MPQRRHEAGSPRRSAPANGFGTEKVARYKHAALRAVKSAGDISTRSAMESMSLDELLVRIKKELAKLAPLIDLEAIWEPRGSRTERGLSKSVLPAGRSGT
jgi:hypothetical protein